MDAKIGVATFQEKELKNTKLRSDMYQKFIKVAPEGTPLYQKMIDINGPNVFKTNDEGEIGITKASYMKWRDGISTTSTFGLRVIVSKLETNLNRYYSSDRIAPLNSSIKYS